MATMRAATTHQTPSHWLSQWRYLPTQCLPNRPIREGRGGRKCRTNNYLICCIKQTAQLHTAEMRNTCTIREIILIVPAVHEPAMGHHDVSSRLAVVPGDLFSLRPDQAKLSFEVTALYISWYTPFDTKFYCDKFQGDCSLKCVPREVKTKAGWV